MVFHNKHLDPLRDTRNRAQDSRDVASQRLLVFSTFDAHLKSLGHAGMSANYFCHIVQSVAEDR